MIGYPSFIGSYFFVGEIVLRGAVFIAGDYVTALVNETSFPSITPDYVRDIIP
jgi:hypothetical protein